MHLDCLALRWLLEGHRWASCPCHQLCPDGLPTGLGAESHPPGCSSHGLFWLVSSESLWGACVNSLPEARFTLSRVMLRPPPHLRGHWTVSGDISDPHNGGDPPSIRHVGAWGAALHPQCPGWLGCQQCLGNGGGQQLPGVLSHEPHHGVSPWPQSPTAGKQREWFSR